MGLRFRPGVFFGPQAATSGDSIGNDEAAASTHQEEMSLKASKE
ncbi:hypothetical protein PC129_g21871 [Phytophthora cactorum]|uniref:Uncharacterized protein n=1 Tax=Phytophthora cactorum TaxID=29920 RepID=A0A329RJX0_9STRA|nr:hypothetical protein Pcac1_g3325 [Phytophthora cactorum]KAG2795481.1 hypothetical protein PC111_g22124 [Phytophthora cactorum]KAG2822507.1 hypothetical protein PC113_g22322 [Phytophthora cactorum]KAG2874958.1 hypothetical protein PC114_g24990 [Phytophthora cactorum]KAG2889201.1 hypothetical protein PC117_g24744 [Phytophthora cactorum]